MYMKAEKPIIKRILWQNIKAFVILVSGIMLGAFLLCLSLLIPYTRIQIHVRDSVGVLAEEGDYPRMGSSFATSLDNWTDTLILSVIACNDENATVMQKAAKAYHVYYHDASLQDSLFRYCNGEEGFYYEPYTRYWHGYQVFLRPLFCFIDYSGFRKINHVLVYAAVVLVLAAMWRRKLFYLIPAYLLAILFLRPEAVARSLQFSPVYFITNAAVFVLVTRYLKLEKGWRLWFYFIIIGMTVSYMDLLTYPLVSLGIPAALWLSMKEEKGTIADVVRYSLAWAVGYAGMWMGKWCLASCVLNENVFIEAANAARIRLNGSTSDGVSRSWSVIKNLAFGVGGGWEAIAAALLVAGAFVIWHKVPDFRGKGTHPAPYLVLCLMPLIWYAALANHSVYHTFFTYRNLAVSVCAVICMVWGGRKDRTDDRFFN